MAVGWMQSKGSVWIGKTSVENELRMLKALLFFNCELQNVMLDGEAWPEKLPSHE